MDERDSQFIHGGIFFVYEKIFHVVQGAFSLCAAYVTYGENKKMWTAHMTNFAVEKEYFHG
ncbi:hypothetical protein KC992_03015 [Candidatus Saccharibacteria bacterium]|nr:hypothetical protein [Candidatus Saccharibacteria bacterium]